MVRIVKLAAIRQSCGGLYMISEPIVVESEVGSATLSPTCSQFAERDDVKART